MNKNWQTLGEIEESLLSTGELRWGILSTGRMADLFVLDLCKMNAKIVAVYSRHEQKAKEFAKKHCIDRYSNALDEFLSFDEIDIVYIATPNHLHIKQSIQAMEMGKHVLCEKPATISFDEMKTLQQYWVANPKVSSLCWREAFLYRSHPVLHTLVEELQKGSFGLIQKIYSQFGIDLPYNANEFRYQKKMGGGVMQDLGGYCLSFSNWLVGSYPNCFEAEATYNKGVDIETEVNLTYSDSTHSLFKVSFKEYFEAKVIIHTSKGKVEIINPWTPDAKGCEIIYYPLGRATKRLWKGQGHFCWAREALEFEKLIEFGLSGSFLMSKEESFLHCEWMDRIQNRIEHCG